MRVFITGGAGFIGSALARHLIADSPHEILVFDKLTYAGTLTALEPIRVDPRFSFVQGDICDRGAVGAAIEGFRPDIITHLAAESHVDRSIDGPDAFIQTNLVGTFTMLAAALDYWRTRDAAAREAFRFHHISTDEVYGTLGPDGFFTEDTPYDPRSPYSASKAGSDHLVSAWGHTYGLPVLITNCSNNYGPYHFPEKLIPLVIIKAIAGEPLPVYGKGDNVRDWLFVEDHARALRQVFERGEPGRTYNIGGNAERRNIDVVGTICTILDRVQPRPDGKPYADQIVHVADRPGHDARYAIDASRIRDELGWMPLQSFEDGIDATVRWYLEHEQWWQPLVAERGGCPAPGGRRMTLALVTGGSGQLGTELQRFAWPEGWEIVAPSLDALDLADSAAIAAYTGARPWDVVINAAAYTAVDEAESDVVAAWQVNALAPAALAAATRSAGIPIVHVSTDYVFSGDAAEAYAPDAPVGPLGVYGASKEGGEQAVRTANPRHAIIRTAWVMSAHGSNFVKTMLRLGAGDSEVRVIADQHGAPTAAADLAAAVAQVAIRLVEDPRAPTGTWHFSNAGATTWHGFASEIFAQAALRGGPNPDVVAISSAVFPTPARRPANSLLDSSAIGRDFGIVPRPWQTALSGILDELLGDVA